MAIMSLTINGQSHPYRMTLQKGINDYSLVLLSLGDFNIDGQITNADLQAMLKALQSPTGYETANSLSVSDLLTIGDFNGDHLFTTADLSGMMNQLVAGRNVTGVPEPAAITLLLVGMLITYQSETFGAKHS